MWRGYFIMFFGSCCCTYMSAFTYVLPKVNRPSHRTCASSLHGGEGKEARCSVVALTRSLQENHNLASLLHARALSTIQLPCIQFQAGPDASLLRDCLQQERFDFTLLTSPQAARVYVQALQTLGEDAMRRNSKVIGIGPGTSVVLQGCGIETLFTPTLPNAITLASEIPLSFGSKVLYPTSTLASHDLQSSLELRGFEVCTIALWRPEFPYQPFKMSGEITTWITHYLDHTLTYSVTPSLTDPIMRCTL